jgi:glyoxylase-like metal-dependent hydrolase (beta-lactamase superfamily II)
MGRSREEIADGVYLLPAGPGRVLNSYLFGDTVIDSGLRWSGPRIKRSLQGMTVNAHALTHAHFDHAGSSAWLCRQLGIPLQVGAADADHMESGRVDTHGGPVVGALTRLIPTRAHPVDRRLVEGDVVGGFEVLETPGHSPGSLAFWRESDRVLLCGDTVTNMGGTRKRPWLMTVPGLLNHDNPGNRASVARLAELRPRIALFGHGPPVTDPGLFTDRVQALAG